MKRHGRERVRPAGVLSMSCAVLLGGLGGAASADSGAADLTIAQIEVGGMIALIPNQGSTDARLVAVNALGEGEHAHLPHHPQLAVYRCSDLSDSAMRDDCRNKPRDSGWSEDAEHGSEAVFDLSAGFDVRLLDSSGVELASGLEPAADLNDYLVELKDLGPGAATPAPSLSAKSTPALRKLAVFRVGLRSGELNVGRLDPREDWTFENENYESKGGKQKLAASLAWRVEVPGKGFIVELCPYGSGCSGGTAKKFAFAASSGQKVQLGLFNEPTLSDSCAQEPGPFNPFLRHFVGYYALTSSPATVEVVLPRYHGKASYCSNRALKGRPPKICVSPIFKKTRQTW